MPDLPKTGWNVVGQRETMGLDPAGKPVSGIEITFELAGKGQFSIFISKDQYSPPNVQAAIAAYAAKISQVHGLNG